MNLEIHLKVTSFLFYFSKNNIYTSESAALPLVTTVSTNAFVFLFLLSQSQKKNDVTLNVVFSKCVNESEVILCATHIDAL
jgi:hypothetical protein